MSSVDKIVNEVINAFPKNDNNFYYAKNATIFIRATCYGYTIQGKPKYRPKIYCAGQNNEGNRILKGVKTATSRNPFANWYEKTKMKKAYSVAKKLQTIFYEPHKKPEIVDLTSLKPLSQRQCHRHSPPRSSWLRSHRRPSSQ